MLKIKDITPLDKTPQGTYIILAWKIGGEMTKKSTFLRTPLPVKPKSFSEKYFMRALRETEKLAGSSFKDSKTPEARKLPSREH